MSPDKIHELNSRINRQLLHFGIVVGVLFLILNAITAAAVIYIVVDARAAAKTNTDSLSVIRAVTGCTEQDTPEQCKVRFQTANTAEGTRRIIEVDCITRRALAGLPAPDPNRRCAEQTPPEVYPGTATVP